MSYEPADLELVVDYHQAQAEAAGHPPRSIAAWRDAAAREQIENERLRPGFIPRAAAGLRARAEGRRITGCREIRGTHGMSHDYDPNGTDTPPAWWSRDQAKREYDERHA
jgi:hypothetical protein